LLRRVVLALLISLGPTTAWAATRPDAGADARLDGKAAAKKPEKKRRKANRYAPVELYQINTKETLKLRLHDDKGMPVKGWKKRFDRFMRCHQTGKVYKMDQRLAQMLYQIGRQFEGRRLEVISGYRHPKVAKNPKSPHKQGLACDFRVAGVSNATLRDYLRKSFDHAGVGYYPNSVFVHLDNRKQGPRAFWIDYAGPGEAAMYAENPGEELRSGRADRQQPPSDRPARAEASVALARIGEAARSSGGGGKGGTNISGRRPVEIKAPGDTFGD